jgi:hypothetical protein
MMLIATGITTIASDRDNSPSFRMEIEVMTNSAMMNPTRSLVNLDAGDSMPRRKRHFAST